MERADSDVAWKRYKEAKRMSNRIYIVGIGPGREEMMTGEAIAAL